MSKSEIAFAAVVLVSFHPQHAFSSEQHVAFFADVRGQVAVVSADRKESRKALVLDYLYANESIKTGEKGRALVVFTRGNLEEELGGASAAVVTSKGLTVRSGKKTARKTSLPLPAVAALDSMSGWVGDSAKFSGIVLRSHDARAGELQNAERHLRKICARPAPQASDLLAWAALLVQLKRIDDAIAALEKAAKASPNRPRVHKALAILHNHLADDLRPLAPDEAEEHEKKFLEHMTRAAALSDDR